MSQDKSSSKILSNDELEGFKKHELQAFLKERGVGQTGNKDKGVLLSLAKLYANIPVVISDPEVSFKDSSSLPFDSVIVWQDAATEKAPIPFGFNMETITSYLSVLSTTLAGHDEDDEEVDVGTHKPAVKGRQMYQSQKLQMAEFGIPIPTTNLVFRANCTASLKKQEIRYPRVVISQQGHILKASCVCPAKADCRCAHVATLPLPNVP